MIYISTKDMTRSEWLEARRRGIGGSDASSIMGQNPWGSPLTVYLDKKGIAPEKPISGAMQQGIDCEDVIAKAFERETGFKVKRCLKQFQHPDYPWMLANVDRQVVGAGKGFVGLECKSTSERNDAEFREGSIPPNYFWQCQHYMAVTGAEEWYLEVMVFSVGYYPFRIPRDENAIAQLIEAERSFWHDHVLANEAPYPIGIENETDIITAMHAGNLIDTDINIDDMRNQFEMLFLYEREAKAVCEKIDAIKNAIRLRMGACTSALCGRFKVTWKEQTRTGVDVKKLRAEQPEIFQMYAQTSVSRPLKIKEVHYGI